MRGVCIVVLAVLSVISNQIKNFIQPIRLISSIRFAFPVVSYVNCSISLISDNAGNS